MIEQFVHDNRFWILPIWLVLGFAGMLIFRRNMSSFYENRSPIWWVGAAISYSLMGGVLLLLSLMTFIKFENAQENDREGDI